MREGRNANEDRSCGISDRSTRNERVIINDDSDHVINLNDSIVDEVMVYRRNYWLSYNLNAEHKFNSFQSKAVPMLSR